MRIRLTAAAPRVNLTRRSIAGTGVRYGEVGFATVTYDDGTREAMEIRVRPGAIHFPDDLASVPLTLEHDQPYTIRGEVALVDDNDERLYVALRAASGELGDQALAEALDRGPDGRGGLSLDLVNIELDGDEIVSADVVAIGQVRDPAFNSARIDQIAASRPTSPATQGTPPGGNMTPDQIARLAALRAQDTLTAEERTELEQLVVLEAQHTEEPAAAETPAPETVSVAASMPAVPGGVPAPRATTQPRRSAYQDMIRRVTEGMQTRNVSAISAALTDIIHTDHTENIEPFAWSGELWSGLQYEPQWSDLFTQGTLTNWEGRGWRFTSTPSMQDYAGDKAAIPSGAVTTEDSSYEAARMAVGVDIDRKFYDFGVDQAFLDGLFQKIRESWEIKLDDKVRAYVLANDVAGTKTLAVATTNADATVTAATGSFSAADVGATISGTGIPAATTILSVTNSSTIELSANATATGTPTATIGAQEDSLLKAAARGALVLKRRRVGNASWVVVNDEDMFDLLDVSEDDLPAFLNLYGIEPRNFRTSPDVPRGTVLAGARQSATVRTLPGSPIRVSAQNLANGGVDEAFFGYWAIEEHHTSGIVSVVYNPA